MIIGLFLFAAAVAAIILVGFTRVFGGSLGAFESAIETWHERDFTVKIATGGKDELSALAGEIDGTIDDFATLIGAGVRDGRRGEGRGAARGRDSASAGGGT